MKYRLFCDMDGVLADFDKGMRCVLQIVHGEDHGFEDNNYDFDPEFRKMMWHASDVYQSQGGQLWYDLDLMEDALILWEYIYKHPLEILSATGDPKYGAPDQKKRWVAEKLCDKIKINLTRRAADKAAYAAPNHILIDDKQKAIGPWREAGGIGILHTSAEETIAQLKELGL